MCLAAPGGSLSTHHVRLGWGLLDGPAPEPATEHGPERQLLWRQQPPVQLPCCRRCTSSDHTLSACSQAFSCGRVMRSSCRGLLAGMELSPLACTQAARIIAAPALRAEKPAQLRPAGCAAERHDFSWTPAGLTIASASCRGSRYCHDRQRWSQTRARRTLPACKPLHVCHRAQGPHRRQGCGVVSAAHLCRADGMGGRGGSLAGTAAASCHAYQHRAHSPCIYAWHSKDTLHLHLDQPLGSGQAAGSCRKLQLPCSLPAGGAQAAAHRQAHPIRTIGDNAADLLPCREVVVQGNFHKLAHLQHLAEWTMATHGTLRSCGRTPAPGLGCEGAQGR